MKRPVLALVAALSLAPALTSQRGPDQDILIARRDAKLAAPFLKAANWSTDYEEARAQAKKTGKVIFAYFTRSYAP